MKEMKALTRSPPEGIRVDFSTDNITNITASIVGPESTPFEGGVFHLKLILGKDYPSVPPKGAYHLILAKKHFSFYLIQLLSLFLSVSSLLMIVL